MIFPTGICIVTDQLAAVLATTAVPAAALAWTACIDICSLSVLSECADEPCTLTDPMGLLLLTVNVCSFWRDEFADEIKGQSPITQTPIPAASYQDCLSRCDDDVK
jgi:hypothetical protein